MATTNMLMALAANAVGRLCTLHSHGYHVQGNIQSTVMCTNTHCNHIGTDKAATDWIGVMENVPQT